MTTTPDVTTVRVKSLEQLVERGQVWGRMAEKYGVTNPVPPWKSSLDAMCDALDEYTTVLSPLTRRQEEDRLSEHQYAELPFPESQLVSLAHSLIVRGVIDEAALASRMAAVRARLESCAPDAKTFPLSSMEGHAEEEGKTDNLNRYNEDMYKQVKAHSIQLSRLANMIESLESQVKQLQDAKLRKHHKTTSVRKKSTSNNSIKTKKKTDRGGSPRSRKK
jgi:hypothetical protein